jgi:hypothetical protein
MNNSAARQPFWYWGAIGLLMLVGAGAVATSTGGPIAIHYNAVAASKGANHEASVEELAEEFHKFRQEVSQLTPQQQQEVWQNRRSRTESLAEQTLYTFFALPADKQQELIDRTIDRIEVRRSEWEARGWTFQGGGEHGHGRWPAREVSGEAEESRPFAELSLEERLALRRDMWEDATMQAYAMRSEFFRLVSERRQDRGIPEPYRRWH